VQLPCHLSMRQHASAYVSIRQPTWHLEPRFLPRVYGLLDDSPRFVALLLCACHHTIVTIRQHASAYVGIRRHTCGCVRIGEDTRDDAVVGLVAAEVNVGAAARLDGLDVAATAPDQLRVELPRHLHTSAHVSTRQHTPASVSIRQHPRPLLAMSAACKLHRT
jgi:hypothetical protein